MSSGEGEEERNERPKRLKFIVTKNGDVYFAGRTDKSHADIAKTNDISWEDIVGGGTADVINKQMYGESGEFGKYNSDLIRDSFPDWKLE